MWTGVCAVQFGERDFNTLARYRVLDGKNGSIGGPNAYSQRYSAIHLASQGF